MNSGSQKPATVGWLLFSLSGRADRRAYLLAVLLIIVLQMLLFFKIYGASPESIESGSLGLAIMAAGLIFVWVSFALSVKRFHDIGRPGIFALVIFIPVLSVIALIALCLMPGEPGANRYGPRTNAPG